MFFGSGYKFLILGRLGLFWMWIWDAFGVHDGGPGRTNLVFLALGQCSSVFLLSGGLQGCFWMIFGTILRAFSCFFNLLWARNCVRFALYFPCSHQASCFLHARRVVALRGVCVRLRDLVLFACLLVIFVCRLVLACACVYACVCRMGTMQE